MKTARGSQTAEVDLARDHLFISYAWEDGALAEWLCRKLTAAGYLVWCDRFKLLGGERWPKNIDRAIKTRTFRMLALLSSHSIEKENPSKERQLALTLSKERKLDFLIPLNIDGLKASDLGWELSDVNFIPFQQWAVGFAGLLKKLEDIDAPRPLVSAGPSAAAATFLAQDVLRDETETLYSNCLEVVTIPTLVHRYTLSRRLAEVERNALLKRWAFFLLDDVHVSAFTDPPIDAVPACSIRRSGSTSWMDVLKIDGVKARHLVTALLRASLIVKCVERGLLLDDDGRTAFFPEGLLPKDKIWFRNYKGIQTHVTVLGERKIGKSRARFQLGIAFYVRSDVGTVNPVVELKIRVHVTDPAGTPLDGKALNARRKKITRGWWNHEWLSRQMAVVHHLSGASASVPPDRIAIGGIAGEQVILSANLLTATVQPRIHDQALEPLRAKTKAFQAQLVELEVDSEPDARQSDLPSGSAG